MSTAFTFDEIPDSREQSIQPPSLTMKFLASGEVDDQTVLLNAALSTAQTVISTIGMLYRQDILLAPAGFARYIVTVPYAQMQHQTGSYTFNFDTTGGTAKQKYAIPHVGSWTTSTANATAAAASNPYNGAIGVPLDGGEPDGADIVVPALKFNVTYRYPQGVVTLPFTRTLASATGCTNSDVFLNFQPGELLFLGATGNDGMPRKRKFNFSSPPIKTRH